MSQLQIVSASEADFEELVALRIRAMQPSLEAVGRFDPQRARERFLQNFDQKVTYKIYKENALVGFYALVNKEQHLWLDHLYIDPQYQGGGSGGLIINALKQQAIDKQLPLRLGALKESRANDFYQKQGFVKIEEQQWDNIYQWAAS